MWHLATSHGKLGMLGEVSNQDASGPAGALGDSSAAPSIASILKGSLRLPPSVIVASFTINLLGLVLPLVVLQIFDRVLRYQALNTLSLLIIGLVCTVIAEAVLRISRQWLVGYAALREGFDLHMQGVTRLFHAPRGAPAKLPKGAVSDALASVDEMSGFLSGNGRLALLDFPFVVVFLILIWTIGGPVVIMPALLIVTFAGWTIWTSTHFKHLLNEHSKLEQERFSFYSECLKGIATVKSLAVEPQMERRLERILQAGALTNYTLVLRSNRMIAAGQLFASLTIVSVVSIGGLLAIDSVISMGAVAACTLITNRVTQPALRIIGVWGQMESARLAVERYALLQALPLAPPALERAEPPTIQLINVAMAKDDATIPSPGINLTIHPAEVIGIISRDFTQRAQLLGLLRGQVQPDRGSVFIDEVDLASPECEAMQAGVFFVGSEPAIFSGTILDNMSMFRRVSHAKAIETARSLGLEPIIQRLPQGYDTSLGDAGAAGLPLDIRQAICIVRAAAVRPRILLIDIRRVPPDDISTRACIGAIKELKGATTIVIFGKHLLEVEDADRIFAIDDWRLNAIPKASSPETGDAAPPLAGSGTEASKNQRDGDG